VVHGSAVNHSPRMHPSLVRGQEPTQVHTEPYPARLPPRWDRVGYRSIFAAQTPAAPPAYAD
jgi:hypothetical protein